MRELQLEFGAEIGRAVVNFRGPIVFCVISRYHGGAFVVFSQRLNEQLETVAVKGARASVIGGSAAAAVVFARDVDAAARADARIRSLDARLEAAEGTERAALRSERAALWTEVRAEKMGELAARFDAAHSVERAVRMGSVGSIVDPAALRPFLIEAVERGMRRADGAGIRRRWPPAGSPARTLRSRPARRGSASASGARWPRCACPSAGTTGAWAAGRPRRRSRPGSAPSRRRSRCSPPPTARPRRGWTARAWRSRSRSATGPGERSRRSRTRPPWSGATWRSSSRGRRRSCASGSRRPSRRSSPPPATRRRSPTSSGPRRRRPRRCGAKDCGSTSAPPSLGSPRSRPSAAGARWWWTGRARAPRPPAGGAPIPAG